MSEDVIDFTPDDVEHTLGGFLDPTAKPPITQALVARAFGLVRGSTGKVWFRGGWTCNCVATSLPWVEQDMKNKGLIRNSIDIFQLGYNGGGVAASAGTHDGGGNIDVAQRSPAHIRVWRDWGWAMQERIGVGSGPHAHGWPIGCPHLSAGAQHQWYQWKNRTNGLANYGPIQGPYTMENWRDALERNFYEMFTLGDIEDRVISGVVKALKKDGVITNNNLTGNPKNPNIAVTSAIEAIARRIMRLEESESKRAAADAKRDAAAATHDAKLEAKLDAILAALKTPPAV